MFTALLTLALLAQTSAPQPQAQQPTRPPQPTPRPAPFSPNVGTKVVLTTPTDTDGIVVYLAKDRATFNQYMRIRKTPAAGIYTPALAQLLASGKLTLVAVGEVGWTITVPQTKEFAQPAVGVRLLNTG